MSNPGPNTQSTQNLVSVNVELDASGLPTTNVYANGNLMTQLAQLTTTPSGGVAILNTDGTTRLKDLDNRFAFMPFGITSGSLSTSGAVGGETAYFGKYALPVLDYTDIVGIQVVIQVPYDAAGTTNYNAVIAATETALVDTATNTYHPIKDGAAVDTLNDTTDAYGWRSATWSGAANITPTNGSSADNPAFAVSDVIPMTMLPRAAADTSVGRYTAWPLIMVRVGAVDATGTGHWNYRALMSQANAQVATANNRGLITQAFFVKGASSAGYLSAPQTNSPPANLNGTAMCVGFIVHTRHGAINPIWFGDSTVEANAINDGILSGVDNAGLNMAARVAETGIPCGWVNRGRSSGTSTVYSSNLSNAITAFKPNVVIFQAFSHNDAPFNTAALMRYKTSVLAGNVANASRLAADAGAKFLVSTGFPENVSVIPDAVMPLHDAYLAAWTVNVSGRTQALNTFPILSDGANPARWVAGNVYDNADDIHPNSAGMILLGGYCASVVIDALAM